MHQSNPNEFWRAQVVLYAVHVIPYLDDRYSSRWQFLDKETLYQTFFERSRLLYDNRPFCVLTAFLGVCLEEAYDVHLMLIGKRVVDWTGLPSDNWTFFSLGATRKYRLEVAVWFLKGMGHFGLKSRSKATNHLCTAMPVNALQLCRWKFSHTSSVFFHTKKLCSRLSSTEVHFRRKEWSLCVLSPLWEA